MNSTDLIAIVVLGALFWIYRNLDSIKEFINDQFYDNDPALGVNSNGTRDLVEVLRDNDKNYLVLYGSQTGTAEDYAKKFGKELTARFQLRVMVADLEHYDFDTLNELPDNIPVTFVISTYGEGDFPDGSVNFEQYLNELDAEMLDNLRFSIFGLGNTTYEFFNGAARKALDKLQNAGARLIGALGEGDDGAGTTDEDYLTWKEETIELLQTELDLSEDEDKQFESSFGYTELTTIENNTSLGEPSKQYLPNATLQYNSEGEQRGPFDLAQPYIAPIIKTKELFQSKDRNCIHTEFDISGSEITYQTGDHLAIWPSNPDEAVSQFLRVFELNPETIFDLKAKDSTMKLPFLCPTTVGAVVRHYLEITGPISRQTLGLLVSYAPESIKDHIITLSKDKSLFASEILASKFNLADALLSLNNGQTWSGVPWLLLIEMLPKLSPRYYSISSSSLSEPNTIHATSIVENTPNDTTGINTIGVTTNLLRNIQLVKTQGDLTSLPVHYDLEGPRGLFANGQLPIHVRHSTFRLPKDNSIPVIMIGPGTGVAPFRGFVRERFAEIKRDGSDSLEKMGKMVLFYGSRDNDDYLYRDEWVEYSKTLEDKFEIDVALSRVQEQKIYVQHRLAERKEEISQLLQKGAYVYVCGDAKRMAKDVQHAIANILSETKGLTESEAQEVVKAMKVAGKYQEDIW
ncbi:similar to Saccharomyces cerevisiae YHR042W NCP1 NADP-cytochrome P450 reductase [Maudiozyma saulgeensis]|uniref:NADPH--cytochrome P450 reductase n=1 Tax=Maudiozyma saulgeensis TaxID=1789683 RepID=A0A1X7R558_9SACH|nr:similar to Saccharomyces cerevisiae YHR042W NCP1 NADP-cytochrome P450 reductase [Kazachstania saulgeensis]